MLDGWHGLINCRARHYGAEVRRLMLWQVMEMPMMMMAKIEMAPILAPSYFLVDSAYLF